MRYVGYLLIVAAGSGMGVWASHRLTRRVRYLHQVGQVLQVVEQQIACSAQPMEQLWRRLAAAPAYQGYHLLHRVAVGLETLRFSEALAQAAKGAQSEGVLTDAGYQLLMEFGAGCGRYDLDGQTRQIGHFRQQFAALEQELREDTAAKGRLYRVLGMAGGVALALLLV